MDPATEPGVPREHQHSNGPESENAPETARAPFVAVPEPFGVIAEEDARNRNEKRESDVRTTDETLSLF